MEGEGGEKRSAKPEGKERESQYARMSTLTSSSIDGPRLKSFPFTFPRLLLVCPWKRGWPCGEEKKAKEEREEEK